MDEQDTFRKLKQIPYAEMAEKIDIKNYTRMHVPPCYTLGSLAVDSTKFYNRELDIHSWRMTLLKKHGWTFEEFMLEHERQAIINQVNEFNTGNNIPYEIIARAQIFFPNAKFVHAHVELE